MVPAKKTRTKRAAAPAANKDMGISEEQLWLPHVTVGHDKLTSGEAGHGGQVGAGAHQRPRV